MRRLSIITALAALVALPSTAHAQGSYADVVASTPGLAAHWRLGEASGTVANDATGTTARTYAGAPARPSRRRSAPPACATAGITSC